jgi:hypothetical protein
VNGHFDYTQTPTQIIASLKSLGMTSYRATWEGSDASLSVLVALAQAFKADGTGIKLYVCLDVDMTSDGTNMWANEAAAFSYALAAGAHCAAALAPYASSIMAFECGNELSRKQSITDPFPAVQGTNRTDYSNTKWPILRGVVAGAMDGVKSVLPGMPCASNAWVFSEFAAADMLWTGTNPDGSTGHRAVKWDITAIHSYHSWGDPMNEPFDGDGTGPRFDYLAYMSNAYGVPIVISEWNGDAGGQSVADQSAWVSKMYYSFYANRHRYNIAAVMIYALYSDPWNVLVDATGLPSTVGAVVQSFIAANPDQ